MSESQKIISENFKVFLQEDEYILEMTLYSNNCIEFKIIESSPMASCYYLEKYDLEKINLISPIIQRDMERVYQYIKRKLQRNKINLLLSENKNIMYINYKVRMDEDEEEIDVKLELKKSILKDDDIVKVLMKEVEQLKKECNKNEKIISELKKEIVEIKKNNDLLMEEYNKKKEKGNNEKKLQEEEEKLSSLNDNVNLTNNFQLENFDESKEIDFIPIQGLKSAPYCIIKNNERLYQIAYSKRKYNSEDKSYLSHIIIYNLVSKKVDNKIFNLNGTCSSLKHYFDSSTKNHILLSSLSYSVRYEYSSYQSQRITLWNISSNPIINILEINNDTSTTKKYLDLSACIMFTNESFLVFGGYTNEKTGVWNQSGNFLHDIKDSNINSRTYIEATYLENKAYILLSGKDSNSKLYYSECYNCNDQSLITYNNNNNNSRIDCINLFKKEKNIYLITGSNNGINVFDFFTAKLKKVIQLGKNVYSLCSINQKYIIASCEYKLKIIDMDSNSVVKTYSEYPENYTGSKNDIQGIQKIKIPEKGEYMLTYAYNYIKIWKL